MPPTNPLWENSRTDISPQPAPADARCGGCTWRHLPASGPSLPRCWRFPEAPAIRDDWPACPAFTAALDCQACGACCGPAYDCVEVERHEAIVQSHGHLLVEAWGQLQLPRPGGRCVCLVGEAPRLSCTLYSLRPQSCRDFPVGEQSCLQARRRVGLTA